MKSQWMKWVLMSKAEKFEIDAQLFGFSEGVWFSQVRR